MEDTIEDSNTNHYRDAITFLATDDLIPMANLIFSLFPLPLNKDNETRANRSAFYHFCAKNFPNSTSLKLLQVYAISRPRFNEKVRESAIRHLNVLLSNHREGGEPFLASFATKELSSLLISCLEEKGIFDDTFKILAQLTYHVAYEVFHCHNIIWSSVIEFILSRTEAEFKKAAYIFNSLSMVPPDGKGFMIHILENIISPILEWLQPSELCREDMWSLAFASAFCVVIHLINAEKVELVAYIVDEMLKSVTELVGRGMEVGFVRRGVREVEMLLRKQSEWYSDSEYEFVLNLMQKMNEITGMKRETKMVLWRIRMNLETQFSKETKKGMELRVADSSLDPTAKPKKKMKTMKLEVAGNLISHLLQQGSHENQYGKGFCVFCWEYLSNGLAEMIFAMYQRPTDTPKIRSKSISLLLSLLRHFRGNGITLSASALEKIKPLLISSLEMPVTQDSDFEILVKITSLVATDVFEFDNNGWEELCDCIVWLADDNLGRALQLFRDLPPVYESFLLCIVRRLFPEILTLLNQELDCDKTWRLALQTGFKIAIQLLESVRRDLAENILYAMLMSASKLVRQEKQEILQRGLEKLAFTVKEYTANYKCDFDQHNFALDLGSMMARMKGAERKTQMAARTIYQILKAENF